MLIKFLLSTFLFTASGCPEDSLKDFQKQLAINIERYVVLPPAFLLHDTCYHHTSLLKVEINKLSKVVAIDPSDSAPVWLKEELSKLKEKERVNYKKLDSLALKAGLRDCTLVFPLILESDYFPCGKENKKRDLNELFFQFNGKNLKGNIIFGKQIKFAWSVNYQRR